MAVCGAPSWLDTYGMAFVSGYQPFSAVIHTERRSSRCLESAVLGVWYVLTNSRPCQVQLPLGMLARE